MEHHFAHLEAELDRRLRLLALLLRFRRDGPLGERVDLLEHARDRGQVCRFNLHQLRHDLLGVTAEVGERAAEVEREQLDQQCVGVREREVEVADLVVSDAAARAHHLDHRPVVAMREHAALRRPGRPRGVDERERVLRAHTCPPLRELLGGARAPALADLVERDRTERTFACGAAVRHGRAAVAGARGAGGGIDHDHRAQARHLLLDRDYLRELLVVLADDRARAGVGDHPQALFGRVGLVDRHDGRAGRGRAHVGVRPLGAGVREDAHAITGFDPQIDHPESDLLHDLRELRVVDVVPGAVALVADGDALRVLGGASGYKVSDRLRPGRRGGGGGLHQDSLPPLGTTELTARMLALDGTPARSGAPVFEAIRAGSALPGRRDAARTARRGAPRAAVCRTSLSRSGRPRSDEGPPRAPAP